MSGPTGTVLMDTNLEAARLKLEVEKLKLEVEGLQRAQSAGRRAFLASLLPSVSTLVAVLAFGLSLYQQNANERMRLLDRHLEIRQQSAAAFWPAQLELYLAAVKQTGILATSEDPQAREAAAREFKELYWGRLAAVEDVGLQASGRAVEAAMVRFSDALKRKAEPKELKLLSLAAAHAVREAIRPNFDLELGQPNPPATTKGTSLDAPAPPP